MKWTVVALIVLGVLAAGAASVLTSSLRAQRTAQAGANGATWTPQVQIVVAARDLPAMGLLDASSVTQKTVPETVQHAGVLSSPHQVVGQILTVPMVEGQPFRRADLAGEVLGLNLAATLPQGLRAMTISLAGDAGIKGLLYPSCLVDVVASFRLPSARGSITGELVSATLLQGVTVLAIGNRSTVSNPATAAEAAESAPNKQHLVTLLVDMQQAEALQLATTHGSVTLVLRNPHDTATTNGHGVFLSDLSEDVARRLARIAAQSRKPATAPPGVAEPPVAPPGWSTVVYRGESTETLTFPQKDSSQTKRDGDQP